MEKFERGLCSVMVCAAAVAAAAAANDDYIFIEAYFVI